MSDIPSDVRREILLCLPAKSVIRFRAVCKSWRSVIDDPSFVKAYTNKKLSFNNTILIQSLTVSPFHPLYTVDLETLNFTNGLQTIPANPLNSTRNGLLRLPLFPMTTCNGLTLVAPCLVEHKSCWEIWNPLTHERLELPHRFFKSSAMTSGIGYDYPTDDYKAVVIDSLYGNYVYGTHVYSLKSDSWRKIMNFPCGDRGATSYSVFLSGALHWISMWEDSNKNKIVVLDLGTESYHELEMPPSHDIDGDDHNNVEILRHQHLDVLDGCLVVCKFCKGESGIKYFDIWVMNDYGAQDSWARLFSVKERDIPNLFCDIRPVAYTKNKRQILLQDTGEFYLFDFESSSVKLVIFRGLCGIYTAIVFHENIYRLHDNCGVSGGVTRERRIMEIESRMKVVDKNLTFCVKDIDFWNTPQDCWFSHHKVSPNPYNSSSEDEVV